MAGEGSGRRALVAGGARPLRPELLASPDLRCLAIIGTGYEGVDVAGLRRRGFQVSYTPAANHEDVADHAIGLLLAVVRKIAEGDRMIRAGRWIADRHPPPTRSLRTLTIGVVGMGAIGQAVAQRLQGFGCQIRWWGPRAKPDQPSPRAASLMELADQSDVLIVCHRADEQNKGLISRAVLQALGRRGVLINVARGSAVDEEALRALLRTTELAGAGLDVFNEEPTDPTLWAGLDTLVMTPHTAGGADASLRAMVAMVGDNLERFFSGRPLLTPAPET